jgi:hypothetical protein
MFGCPRNRVNFSEKAIGPIACAERYRAFLLARRPKKAQASPVTRGRGIPQMKAGRLDQTGPFRERKSVQ